MNLIKQIFGSLDNTFIIRNYVIGIILTGLFLVAEFSGTNKIGFYIFAGLYALISLLLFPFSKYLYGEIVGFIFKDVVFFRNIIIHVIWSGIRDLILFLFSIIIAPIGIVVLLLRVKYMKK